MATLTEYFEKDFPHFLHANNKELTFKNTKTGGSVVLNCSLHYDSFSNAIFLSIFIDSGQNISEVAQIVASNRDSIYGSFVDKVGIVCGNALEKGFGQCLWSRSNKIYLYFDGIVSDHERSQIENICVMFKINIVVRDREYQTMKTSYEKPLAFICHDSRDKDLIARPIAEGLSKRMCPVWYDEYSLKVGDKLRESIERGLKEAKKCILVLTPNFINNPGWTKTEFNSIFTRELIEMSNVILPVWNEVTPQDIYSYSPSLADRVALNWSLGGENVIQKLHIEIVRTL